MTREEWLERAAVPLRKALSRKAGLKVPDGAHLSVGFPKGHRGRQRAIGQCWAGTQSADGLPHVFICPTQTDSVAVLGILAHELIHAALPGAGHKRPFSKAARAVGLVKPWTATTVGDELRPALEAIVADLGAYPHAGLVAAAVTKKVGSRLRLWECGCGVKVRVARDDFDATCGLCGGEFERKG